MMDTAGKTTRSGDVSGYFYMEEDYSVAWEFGAEVSFSSQPSLRTYSNFSIQLFIHSLTNYGIASHTGKVFLSS